MTSLLRRSALKLCALGASAVALPAVILRPAFAQTVLPRRATPAQTEGPFYPDEALADTDSDLLNNGQVAYTSGQPAWLSGVVSDLQGRPVAGAEVQIWQCDHEGHYRHSRSPISAPMAFQGFGKVQVGADGRYKFRTIKPVAYPGRPPHIHMKIKLDKRELLTTQMYVSGEAANARDFSTRSLSATDRSSLEATFTRGADGWQAEFGIVVKT